jgi:hypothetical protein
VSSVRSVPVYYKQDELVGKVSERGLNLAVVKFTTVQMTNLPLKHKIRKIGMICFEKPVTTEDLYIVQK